MTATPSERSATASVTAPALPSVRRLLLLLVLGCLLPGAIGAVMLFTHLFVEGDQQLRRSTLEMTRTLVRDVDDQFVHLHLLASMLAQSRALAGNDLAAFHREARALLAATPVTHSVVLSDVHGQPLLDTLVTFGTPLAPHANQPQVRQVVASGRAVTSDVFAGAAQDQFMVAVSVPVVIRGTTAYVLSALMPPPQLDAVLQRHPLPPDWIVSVFDSSGTIAARYPQPDRLVGHQARQSILDIFLVQSEGIHEARSQDGIPLLAFFSTSATSHWKVAIGIPASHLMTALMLKVALIAAVLLALFGLGAAMALHLGRRISSSVTALTLPARDLAAGRALAAPRVYFYEAGEVALAMARSAVELLASEQALKSLNRDLESRVQQRTREAIDLYERAPCGYHALDAAGIVIQVNQTELDLLGYEREEYLGHPIRQFMTPDSRTTLAERHTQLLSDGQVHDIELDFVHKDGSVVPCLVSANIELDAQGGFTYLRSTVVDNRIGKARQQQITALNAFLNGVLESLPFGVAVLDAQQQVVFRNGLFGTIQGYPPELLRQEPVRFADMLRFSHEQGHYPQRLYEDVLAEYVDRIALRQPLRIERRQPNGTYLEIRGQPVSNDWVLLTYTDITPFRLAEQALSQARTEAETANLAKSAFLANMTHELRTPLNAVIGLARLMADSPLSAWQRDYADKIRLSAQSVQALINDILDLSKMEANALRIEHIPFSLDTLMRTVASVLGLGIGQKDIAVVLDLAAEVPDALIGDPLRVQQILLNLVSNALKFTERGEIVVSVRCQSPQPATDGAPVMLQVSVRDTGIGIGAQSLETIFNAFVQADESTSRLYGGTGLGLAISHRLVTMMGGQINVESLPGQGSEFRFSLPLMPGTPVASMRPDHALSGLRVLIVEGHALTRALLRDACLASGWQVCVADTWEDGYQVLLQASATHGAIDLLLLDGRLPGGEAMTLLRTLHASPDIVLPRTLLMVPLLDLEQFAGDQHEPVPDGVVPKPMTRWSLAEAVARLFPAEPLAPVPQPCQQALPLSGLRLLVAEDNVINQQVTAQILTGAGAEVVLVGDGVAVLAALTMPAARFDMVLMDIRMPLMDGYASHRLIRETLGLVTLPVIALTSLAQGATPDATQAAGMAGFLAKPLELDALLAAIACAGIAWIPRSAAAACEAGQSAPATIRLSGLDFVAALKVFGGDQARLAAILRTFVARQGDDAVEAGRLFDCNDIDAAIDLVHQLRGVAASLHARELFHLAGLTESALLDGDVAALPSLFGQLEQAMTMIRHCQRQLDDSLARP